MIYLKFISICGILTFPSRRLIPCVYVHIYIYFSHYNVDVKYLFYSGNDCFGKYNCHKLVERAREDVDSNPVFST